MTVMSLDDLNQLPLLTDDEMAIVANARPIITDDCPEMTDDMLKEFHPWYDRIKQSVTIDLDITILNYFRRLSVETGLSLQNLMELFLTECARGQKKPQFTGE